MWCLLLAAADGAPLAFDDAVRLARGDTPSSSGIEAARDASTAAARAEGRFLDDPTLSAETHGPDWEARAELPLPLAGQSFARARRSRATRDLADHTWQVAQVGYVAEVGRAYLDLERATELDRLASDTLTLALRLREAALARNAAGETGAVEAAIAGAVAATDATRASRAHQAVAEASLRLEVLLGLEPVGDTTPLGWPDLDTPDPDRDPDGFPAAAAARDRADRLRADATLASMDLLRPSATLGLGDAHGLDPIVGVSLPIPLAGPSTAKAAHRAADGATAGATQAELQIRADWRGALLERASAEQAWTATEVPGLAGSLDALARAFEAGELSLGEYVLRRDAVVTGLAARIEARWRLEAAALALWELAGELPGGGP